MAGGRSANSGVARQLLAAVALVLCVWPARGAEATDPQRVEERLPDQPKGEAPASAPVQADSENLASIQPFTLKWVAFEGMTAIDRGVADDCAAPLIGKSVGAASLVGLTECVTKIYRKQGYFLSRAIIPPQQVQDGALKIHVIEGYIAAVEPEGISKPDVDAQFARTLAERPAQMATFERNLLLLTDLYGRRVTSSRLAPDPSDAARFTLKLTIETSPVTWRIFGDNRGDARQGPEQTLLSVAWNAPFGANDRVMGQLFTAPTNSHELIYGDLSYGRVWGQGAFWTEFGVSASRATDGSALPEFTSLSERKYARLSIPIMRTRRDSLWARLQFDARDADVTDLIAPATHETTRVLRGSFSYTLVDGGTRADVVLEASKGLDGLGTSQNGDPNLSRPDARPQFTKLRLDGSVTQRLFDELEIAASGAAQLSDGALPASEEFGVGGARFGRAYNYSEIVGDDALAGSIELRWTWRKLTDWLTSVQLYGFADAGRIWNAGGSPSFVADASRTSAGGGLRISVAPGLRATVELAKPLSNDVASQGDKNARIFVSLSAGW